MKKRFNLWMIPTIICGIIAMVSIIFYVTTLNMALVILILLSIAGTGYGLYKIANFSNIRFDGISEQGPATGEINAFCIYGKVVDGLRIAEKVQEEWVEAEHRLGDRWFFDDLGQWLYVLFNDLGNNEWKAFELPDAEYTSPARLAIPLNMGRVNELFQLEPSLFDQLKPWILVLAISVIGFLIFLSGS